ncbi:MAG: hypothetical protein OEW30_01245 [Acidimicrobiia bacterium]|nr:hypothetical protein [Acidimicrobiia bacterium]
MRGKRKNRRTTGVVLAIAVAGATLLGGALPAVAIPITIVDDAGPDDEPGQKDLNQLTVDFDPGDGDLSVTWNWDAISVSGANTGDACSLYDTDDDGNANYSLCVIWDNGSSYQTTRLYLCGDGAADKCDQPRDLLAEDMNLDGDLLDAGEALVLGPYNSTCSLSTVADTFGTRGGAQADTDFDTQATCDIELDDFGGGDAFLINVCSYPSQVPGSDPSDCVISPNSGFLTIVKVADPDDPATTFTFDLGAGQEANDGRTSFSIEGSGSVELIAIDAGANIDLSEVVPAGWTLDGATCSLSNGDPTGTFTSPTVSGIDIQVGRLTSCTFTNTQQATLTLVKTVVNDNGGTAALSEWTLTADSTTFVSGTAQEVAPGTYTLAESGGPIGYTASGWVCVGGTQSGDDVTLAAGESATCTITNDDDAPSLTLVKEVTNDNGGTAQPGDWTLTAAGYDPASPDAGTYALSESGPAGYTLTSLTCDNAVGQVTSVTLGLGESVTCTFVNDDDAPSLTLVKEVTNDNGGTAQPGDWTLTAAGYDPASPDAGTYALSESGPAGYTLTSLTCDNAVGQVTSVTLGLGESVTCTFENDDISPTLTVIKTVVNDNGGTALPNDFKLTVDGGAVSSGVTNDFDAGAHTVAETNLAGYSAGTWGGDCAVDGSITLSLAQDATCTITNDDIEPSLTLVKVVNNGANPGGTATEEDFELTASGPTGFSGPGPSVDNGASFDAGSYDLSEAGPAGYMASDWVCVGGSQTDGDTVSIGLGEDVTCTITNTAMGMTTLTKLTQGLPNETMVWNFTLSGPGVDKSDSTPPTTVDFGGVYLIPGEEYTLCEVGIPAGWTSEWQVDTDGDGVPDTIIPMVASVDDDPVGSDGYSRVYDPNYVATPGQYTNDTRCVNFTVGVGETLAFQIDNRFPGGEPRTIGFWKNWNTCTGGNQTQTAANNGGASAGWFILDDLLNNPGYTIGDLQLDGADCQDAVRILDKRSIDDGTKRASDGAYNLASQLLAAQLNLSAGAETCQAVVDAVNAGQTLLASIDFDGTGSYLKGKKAAQANALAAILDAYNNGELCG